MNEVLTVQSEIYEEEKFESKTSLRNKNLLLNVHFLNNAYIKNKVKIDEEGDLIISRKDYGLQIECSPSTTLELVGLQLWRGAFLMADYILYHKAIFENKNVLELGTGVGLTSIIAGFYANEVISTDIDDGEVLSLLQRNISRNKDLTHSKFTVLPLNFYNRDWSSEFKTKLSSVDVIIAADVIYDDNLSEAFLETLLKILDTPDKKILYMALEKRFVFTISELNTVAPCYEYFLNILLKKSKCPPMASWQIRQVPLNFDQSLNYIRTEHLVLWEIST